MKIIVGCLLIILGFLLGYLVRYRQIGRVEQTIERNHLTQLLNRMGVGKAIDTELNKYAIGHFAILKIYGLSDVNNRFGHQMGDRAIQEIAGHIEVAAAKDSILGHVEGNEFVYYVKKRSKDDVAYELITILESLEEFFEAHTYYQSLRVSASYCEVPHHGETYDELYKHCEYALTYGVERYGERMMIQPFSYDIYNKFLAEQTLVEEIRRAIIYDEFVLYIQSQVELPKEYIIGGEILARWQHPTEGILSPARFIPLIEKYGLIKEFDYYILDKAVRQIAEWQQKGAFFKVSVNITTETFIDYDFIPLFRHLVELYDIDLQYLYLEITEDMSFNDLNEAERVIEKVHHIGAKIALDDFGKGYSSLNYLQKLQVDTLKLDKQFIDTIHTDSQARDIYQVVSYLATVLDIPLVVEGIEKKEQLDQIKDQEGLIVQGFYYSYPMDVKEYVKKRENSIS